MTILAEEMKKKKTICLSIMNETMISYNSYYGVFKPQTNSITLVCPLN